MAVKLRLTRMGAKKKPFYRIVAIDSAKSRDGQYIEQIGIYDPVATPSIVKIDKEKAQKWLNTGAQPTETVRSLFVKEGIIKRPEKNYKAKDSSKAELKDDAVEAAVEVQSEKE
ncbi:MAG: 30S ribosomal protein S16 [Clostridiales bacterium]|jgi:small subunit ribosomal protein S16|nr:30S ribosomal protein S16 [Clostridiales bacterium]